MRELQATSYDSNVYKDENLLYKNKLIDPVTLKKNLTYLWGKDSDMFPLHTLTEGQGALKSVKPTKLNDTQYTWDVMGRMRDTTRVVGLVNTGLTKPGLAMQPFEMIFEDNWIHAQYGAVSPDGQYQIRVNSEAVKIGVKQWKAWVVLKTIDPAAYISLDNFIAGKAWAQTATSIAASKSDGTTSNTMLPGKWTNQFGLYRYSQQIAGNISNKALNIEFDLADGSGKTNLWMPMQMKQFEVHIRKLNEERLWFDEYNRNSDGEITLKDPDTGEPIPHGAGVKQSIKAVNNYDTYSVLTKTKLDNTVKSVFNNRVDDTPMEIVLYTGMGGAEMFHNAIMADATGNSYYQALGTEVITGGEYLTYGKYFRQYRTIDGKLITVKVVNLFDHGSRANAQRENGLVYNGYPHESYTLVFLDQSKTNDGDRNVMMVAEAGREYLTGIYRGMSPIPDVWGKLPSSSEAMLLSTRKDLAAYEVMGSAGIAITNPTTSFWLDFAR